VKNLRRAIDVLVSLDEVDPDRIVYVGHDFGAMYGAVVVSVDRRPKGLIFIAGATRAPKEAKFYDCDHEMNAEATRDQALAGGHPRPPSRFAVLR
jgi:hypothetical protein